MSLTTNSGNIRLERPQGYQSGLSRDIEIVDVLSTNEAWERGGLTVSEVAQITNRDKAQVSRALSTLRTAGLVNRHPASRRYRIGSRFYEIASRTQEAFLVMAAQKFLLDVVAMTQEAAHMSVLSGGLVHTLRTENASKNSGSTEWQGKIFHALDSAAGRSILATFTNVELKAWFAEHQALTLPENISVEETSLVTRPVTFRELRRALAGIQERGYAIMAENYEPGVVYAASPVRDGQGRVVAAISVGMPMRRLRGNNFAPLGLVTARVAQDFSQALGGSLFQRDSGLSTATGEIPVILMPAGEPTA